MSDTSKTPAGASSQDLLVRGREITYRVARVILRTGSGIAAGFAIQARRQRAKTWLPCVIDGTPLRYWNAETAHKHCAWLNDPSGTEPEWGRDESPNAKAMAREALPSATCSVPNYHETPTAENE